MGLLAEPVSGQVLLSEGTYSQNFNSLASSGTANTWTDNVTMPGWYAAKTLGGAVTSYRAGTGSDNNGALYSFGASGSTERALGSAASGTPGNFTYGVRFTNDTAIVWTNATISYTGEQWRNGGNATAQKLAFYYCVSSSPFTNSDAAATLYAWTAFTSLDFITPTVGTTASELDGNAPANRQNFTNVPLPDIIVQSGQELFLRWLDLNDSGYDHAVAIDDLTVSFEGSANLPPIQPTITTQPQSQTVVEGATVSFAVTADGYPPPGYQWQHSSTNLSAATNATLTLTNVTLAQAGDYVVVVTNIAGSTNSQSATLVVDRAAPPLVITGALTLLTYNVAGNGATDWSTNAPQVQAIGRQMQYLQPDIITFQEIPYEYTWQMTNFVAAFLPGYALATNSVTDGSIRSAILSRYPITRSTSWLPHADLNPFGYTNANFTRDLFEAQITVPAFSQPLHVFTTHLKSTSGTTYADAAARRAAEAAAITNFFATNLFVLYPNDPYVLTGDMNDSDTNALAIQRLISQPTGLHLTNPTNPASGKINTYSIRGSVTERIDFIFPGGLLCSNIAGSQVFRTDLLSPLPAGLNATDDSVASDHLPVFMAFGNPSSTPFRLLSIDASNQVVTLKWESANGRQYRVDASPDLAAWTMLATNLTATGTNCDFSTNSAESQRFFRVYRVP